MQVYLNPMQREVLAVGARDNVIVAGRGTGKSLLHAAVCLRNFLLMPGSTTAFVCPDTRRAKTNTLPSMLAVWERWGYRRGVHWDIGRRPSKALGWPPPLFPPEDWENVISFCSGAVGQIISQSRSGTSNSKSFDFVDIDEAKFIDFDRLKDETFPANRGQQAEFGRVPWHHGMLVTSDMPVSRKGSWFMKYEKECDRELIETVKALAAEEQELERELRERPDSRALRSRREEAGRLLARLRSRALLFGRYSSLTNIEVLGEAWVRQMRRDLPPMTFRASILCQEPGIMRDGFYSSMRPRHKYTPADSPELSRLGWDFKALRGAAKGCRMDTDIISGQPLCIAFDYNANINWLVVGQNDESQGRMNTLRSFYVKYERKLPALVSDFCDWYEALPLHEVVYYYDSTALGSNYAVSNQDFRWTVCHELRKRGWRVFPVYIGPPMRHIEKHALINRAFDGGCRLTPYFNAPANPDLLISIQTAGVWNGKKDKRAEKLAETEEDRLEGRTDGSDAWDTLFIGCERFPRKAAVLRVTAGG